MPVDVFIQERSGDYNLEFEAEDMRRAKLKLENIKAVGGYWLKEEEVPAGTKNMFIPWHRVDYVRFIERNK